MHMVNSIKEIKKKLNENISILKKKIYIYTYIQKGKQLFFKFLLTTAIGV